LSRKGLTEAAIKHFPFPASRQEIADGLLPGLYLQLEPSGTRSWVVRYRAGGRTRKQTLGRWPAIPLAAARNLARDAILAVKQGRDPAREKRDARRLAKTNTLKAIADAYLDLDGRELRSAAFDRRTLERLVYPELGRQPIPDIKRSDIARLLDGIQKGSGPVMADRTLAIVRRVLNWHASRDDDFRSPIVKGMSRTKPRERARKRILSDDELRLVWNAADQFEGPFGPFIQFLLLTAARRTEAAEIAHSEIKGRDWTLPAARNKTKEDLLRPLSPAALAALARLPEINGCPFPFTTDGKSAISGFSKFKAEFDRSCGVSGWTLHDLRRTARSLMSRAGVDADHAERCLGHVISGVRSVYDRHQYYAEKARAFEALAGQIEMIIRGRAQNVVPWGSVAASG
jgi:integrase